MAEACAVQAGEVPTVDHPGSAPAAPIWVAILPAVAAWVVGLGWFLHTSPRAVVLGKYSPQWATFLGFVLVGEIALTAWVLFHRARPGFVLRRIGVVAIAAGLTGVLIGLPIYVISRERYLARTVFRPLLGREHPFLQWDPALPGSPALAKPPGTFRIVCMGGSTTEGYRVPVEQSYPARLGRALHERFPDRAIEVINAGSCWHTSQHTLIKYLTNICDYDPDLLIVMHAWNDIYQASERVLARGPYRRDYGHFLGAATSRFRPEDRFLRRIVHNPFFDNCFSDLRGGASADETVQSVDPLTPLPSFRRNLGHLAQICLVHDVRLALVGQPSLYKPLLSPEERRALQYGEIYAAGEAPTPDQMFAAMSAFNATARQVAYGYDVPFIPLDELLPRDLQHFIDDVHWTYRGYEATAEIIFEGIDWEGMLGERKIDLLAAAQAPTRQ